MQGYWHLRGAARAKAKAEFEAALVALFPIWKTYRGADSVRVEADARQV